MLERLEPRWLCAIGLVSAPEELAVETAAVSRSMSLAPVPPTPPVTMLNNGPSANRVDMVFLGDGYTAGQIDTQYVTDINAMLDHMFKEGEDPFPRYNKFFNVHRINVVSNESGADVPPEDIFRDTALNASYYFDGVTDRLLSVNTSKANAALNAGLAGTGLTAEMKLVTVNDSRHGGAGGTFAVYAGSSISAPEVALHELGHSFSNLADEYDLSGGATYTGSEPQELNVTKSATGQKWAKWLGYTDPDHPELGAVGAFEGGYYNTFGIYRPTITSKMQALNEPFNAISREKIIRDIYDLVDPLDAWLDNTSIVMAENPQLSVDVVDPAVIHVEWQVNGIPVPGASGATFRPADFGLVPDTYTVTARAFDPTPWVRGERGELEESVSWTVTILNGGAVGNDVATQVIVDNPARPLDKRLVILGSDDAQQIVLDLGFGGEKNKVRLSGGGGTTINGSAGPVEFAGITKGITVQLLDGNDRVTVNGSRMKGPVTLEGGLGDDTYVFASTKIKYVLNEAGGTDLFDFSQSTKGVSVNLAKSTGRSQKMGGGNSLKLTGEMEHLIGSPFNDKLLGNAADNVIRGGGGKDTLSGGLGGFDLLIGGAGKDKLISARGGHSLLIGGSIAHDADDEALLAILNEWRREVGGVLLSLDARIAHLTGDTAGGLNGDNFLTLPGTVADDGLADTLKGLAGNNWFFKSARDKLKGQLPTDRIQA